MRRFCCRRSVCHPGLTAAACKRPVPPRLPHRHRPTAAPARHTAAAEASTTATAAPAPLTDDQIFAQKTVDQLNAERPLGDVLFDLDSATLRDDGRAVASRNADYLKRWTGVRITVEGHADTRGTSEYNLALGERRAAAVKTYIVSLGVPADRITTVSKGKEQPVCTEEIEACWQRNRRGFHIITAK